MAERDDQIQKLLDIVVLESEKLGLTLNLRKIECMVVSKKSVNPNCGLTSKGKKTKQVTKFKYLDCMITSGGRRTTEIGKRIAMAEDTFQLMKAILTNRNIKVTTKIRV